GLLVGDLRELHVGAVGKRRVVLDHRPHAPAGVAVEAIDEDHAVGIADGHRGRADGGAVGELQRYRHHVAVGPIHGNLGRAEGGAAHLHDDELHAAAAHAALALHHAALGVHGEAVLLGVAVVAQPLGEDAQAV